VHVAIAHLEGLSRLPLHQLRTIGQRALGAGDRRCHLGLQALQLRIGSIAHAPNEILYVRDEVLHLVAGGRTGLLRRVARRSTESARIAPEIPCCRFHGYLLLIVKFCKLPAARRLRRAAPSPTIHPAGGKFGRGANRSDVGARLQRLHPS
jgi:hypothetical protein